MSVQQYFSETEAVVSVLSDFAQKCEPEASYILTEEEFTALWQAAELLSRAYSVLLPMVQFEQSKAALNLPDVQKPKPKQSKKAHLYGADGRPING